jgi:arabinogalactan endo-1,4-beta-galactosidase
MKSFLLNILAISLAPLHAAPWFDGADLSALDRIEELGGTFRDDKGQPTDALAALASAGANCVRLRLFVAPDGRGFTHNDLPRTLAMAKRAKAAKQAILLDFHYSDTWADPGHQGIPASWPQDSLPALAAKVEDYTFETLRRFAEEGVFPDLVQIGNEIENGLLWPHGEIHKGKGKAPNWDGAATLFKSAARGVRRATPEGLKIRIVLHTATGGNVETTATFHREMQRRSVDYDVAGLSFYPWWHGTLEGLRKNAEQLATTFGKEVFVVEAGFSWNAGTDGRRFDGQQFAWPMTPEGQASFLRDVCQVIHDVPNGRGIGVLWWHPDSIPVKGAHIWLGGSCALWRTDGSPLPALGEFARF